MNEPVHDHVGEFHPNCPACRPAISAPDAEVPRKTDDEIEELARDITANLVWLSAGGRDDLDPFEGALRLTLPSYSQGFVKSIGFVYEYMSEAISYDYRVNLVLPIFRSARFLHRDDAVKLVEAIRRLTDTAA